MPPGGFLVITPSGPVHLGNVPIGGHQTVSFTAFSGNGQPTGVISINVSGSEWSTSHPSLPRTVGNGVSFQFTVTIIPAGSPGPRSTILAVVADTGQSPINISIDANAVAPTTFSAQFVPSALGFPDTRVGQTVSLTTSLQNTGSGTFQVTALTFASSIAPPVFLGTGLNDMTSGGAFTGASSSGTQTYVIIIDGTGTPDTFKWQLNGGSFTTGVAITGSAQTLSNGVQVTFAGTTSHTLNDQWTVVVTPPRGVAFELISPPALPFTLAAGASQTLTVGFNPPSIQGWTDSLIAVTDLAGSVSCALQGVSILNPIAVLANNIKQVVVGGYDASGLSGKPAPLISSPFDYNSDQAGSIVFNGALWEALGMEKTIFRLGFYYENLGVVTLTGTLVTFRPQGGVDNFQTVSFSITLGTALADQTSRYEEVDVIATGEIITLSLARAASVGPVSIIAIAPYFEPRGEKVRAS